MRIRAARLRARCQFAVLRNPFEEEEVMRRVSVFALLVVILGVFSVPVVNFSVRQ